jgi:hypothetical protein
VGGAVQLGPLGTAAINRPIVPAPGDYDVGKIGGMIGNKKFWLRNSFVVFVVKVLTKVVTKSFV